MRDLWSLSHKLLSHVSIEFFILFRKQYPFYRRNLREILIRTQFNQPNKHQPRKLDPQLYTLGCPQVYSPTKGTLGLVCKPQRKRKQSSNWNLKEKEPKPTKPHVFLYFSQTNTRLHGCHFNWAKVHQMSCHLETTTNQQPSYITIQLIITTWSIHECWITSNINSIKLLLVIPSYFRVEPSLRCRYKLSNIDLTPSPEIYWV